MFSSIFRFELKYRFIRPATYIYFVLCAFYIILIGTIGTPPFSEKVMLNSPRMISNLFGILSVFGLMIGSAVMGMPVYRDHEHLTGNYLFATPMKEKSYLAGRFLGSFATLVFIFFGLVVGLFIATEFTILLKLKNFQRIGSFNLVYALHPFVVILLPNLLFSGALFFSLVALTKKVSVTYVVSILLFIAYLLGNYLVQDLENKTIVDLLDPFALNTYEGVVKYYSIAEQNTKLVPLSGAFLWNRLIWLGVSFLLLGFTFYKFSFQNFLAKASGKRKAEDTEVIKPKLITLPKVHINLGISAYIKQTFHLAKLEFRNIVRDPYFLAILLGGLIFLFLDGFLMYGPRGSENLPLTLYMLEAQEFDYFLFAFILITFYTGEVVHRDRSVGFNGIADTMPVPNWLVYGSKILSLVYMAFLLALLPIFIGILNQALKGFFFFEIDLYLKYMLFITFPEYLQYLALAFFVHVLVNNKFAGHGITIGVWFVMFCLRAFLELDYNLFFYGYEPSWEYSDMNGFGHFVQPLLWFNIYWLALAGVLFLIGTLLWNRGINEDLKTRFKLAKSRLNLVNSGALLFFILVFLGAGAYIFYNVSILNTYKTSDEVKEEQVAYEKKYKRYELISQPKVSSLAIQVNIFPEERKTDYTGQFWLKNKTQDPIDSLHLEWIDQTEFISLKLDGNEMEPAMNDEELYHRIYALQNTLQPDDSILLEVEMTYGFKGFSNSGQGLGGPGGFNLISYNGTFLNTGIFPTIGYNSGKELTSDLDREKYGLPEKPYRMPEIDHPFFKQQMLFTDDADLVKSDITISTVPDQIAVAPGYLEKEWEEDGRHFYHYVGEKKGQLFFSFVSAQYDVLEKTYQPAGQPDNEVKIQVYHHPTHTYNLDYFVEGTEDALDYYTQNFSPYQHHQLRILEFPRYSGFAQSFDGTVPFSESFGWVNNHNKKDKANITYWVTAHEVAHQWWGHQLIGRATRGSNIMSESLADYSAGMVLLHGKGKEQFRNMVREEGVERYLTGRAGENKVENIWLESESQGYLDYNKGLLAMNAFRSYFGEEKVNAALHTFMQDNQFPEKGPFISTYNFYDYIEKVAPDSLKYLAEDYCKHIVLYENRLLDASYEKVNDDLYKVKIKFDAKKYLADGNGKEDEQEMKDLIELGIFTEDEAGEWEPLKLERYWLTSGEQEMDFEVTQVPVRVAIDPYNLLIDKNPEDNVKKL